MKAFSDEKSTQLTTAKEAETSLEAKVVALQTEVKEKEDSVAKLRAEMEKAGFFWCTYPQHRM